MIRLVSGNLICIETVRIPVEAYEDGMPTIPIGVTMQIGTTVSLECSFGPPGAYYPEWSKSGRVITGGGKFVVSAPDAVPSCLAVTNAGNRTAVS